MRRLLNARWKAVVAAVTAAALAALSVVALLSSGPSPETSHDLEREFRALDARYQTATQEFVDAAKALKTDDLSTTLQLLAKVSDAVAAARRALVELDPVAETERPQERLAKALQVESLALAEATEAARQRDGEALTAASKEYETAVLAYQVAREQMRAGLEQCGERCR